VTLDAPDRDPVEALTQVARLIERMHERGAREQGLSPTLARLLGTLSGRAPTMNELAGALDLDKSSISGLVDRAQRRGLVRRIPSQIDRRAVRIRLTDAGLELVQRLQESQTEAVAALLDALAPAEVAALTESLSGILAVRAHR
jgi:DNA-binding MarR family transcriptional regulator